MTWTLVLPGVAAVAVGLAAGRLQRHLRPAVAVRVLVALAVMTALGVAGALGAVAFGFAARVPWIVERVGWCRTFSRSHDAIPAWLGVLAAAALMTMVAAMARSSRHRRRAVAGLSGSEPVQVLPTPEPIAFAVPGRPGHIVVSQGMLVLLDEREQRALFAHERSHLANRHHRYTATADLAAVAVPVLRSLADQVRFATERWADEDAAAEVGDRRVVARAIARAALGGDGRVTAGALLALNGTGVIARVEALAMAPAAPPVLHRTVAAGTAAALLTVAGSTLQLHHVVAFAAHVCNL